jgi:hypothetical protein
MVEQILSLSLRRNIPVANFTVTVGFETTPQKMQQMQVTADGPAGTHMFTAVGKAAEASAGTHSVCCRRKQPGVQA